eukprot:10540975-Karenia_brevis.AAC.1
MERFNGINDIEDQWLRHPLAKLQGHHEYGKIGFARNIEHNGKYGRVIGRVKAVSTNGKVNHDIVRYEKLAFCYKKN